MLALDDEDNDEVKSHDESDLVLPQKAVPNSIEVVHIGEVGVDSGQLMVTDPYYIDEEWQRDQPERGAKHTDDAFYSYSYDGVCNATINSGHGKLAFKLGHAGADVVFNTAWGDGLYPVYAELHDGRTVRVYVNVG